MTHPFHPLHGRTYAMVTYRHIWGDHRVYFHDASGCLVGMPAQWTSVVAPDPCLVVSAGRSHFRVDDLLRLGGLIEEIRGRRAPRQASSRPARR